MKISLLEFELLLKENFHVTRSKSLSQGSSFGSGREFGFRYASAAYRLFAAVKVDPLTFENFVSYVQIKRRTVDETLHAGGDLDDVRSVEIGALTKPALLAVQSKQELLAQIWLPLMEDSLR